MADISVINPCVVDTPDGRTGILTGRMGLAGLVEFGTTKAGITVTAVYHLHDLGYWVVMPARRMHADMLEV